jgi:hypothetical protein
MALGFQDCCNSSSYFFLNGIPATVSQNEFYHIITLEGPAFCATYTNIPALNYQPPTYTLVEMTEYTSCDTCFAGASLTCPAQETIFLSQFGAGSISVGTDCTIKTIFPMIVECFSTNPTFDGFADGVVRVFVTGGTPPYSFFNVVDGTAFGGNVPAENSIYTLIDGALEGTYIIRVVDAQGDYNIIVYCVLESPPTELSVLRTANSVSIADACDGTIVVGIAGGTEPYLIFSNGFPVTSPITDLCAGDYDIVVIDSGVGLDQQISSGIVSVGAPGAVSYPNQICLTFGGVCNTTFSLTFTRQGNYNFRANYVCDDPGILGLTQLILRWENGWTTTQETSNGNINFTAPCPQALPGVLVQFVKNSAQSEQPTGTWSGNLGLFQGQSGTVAVGACTPGGGGGGGPVVAPILNFVASNALCGQLLGQVVLTASGGAGAPFQYLIGGIAQPSQTVQLSPGNYTATAIDSNNTQSNSVNFTIAQDPPANITMALTIAVQPGSNNTGPNNLNGQVAGCNASTGVNCNNIYDTYQPIRITVDLNGLPAGEVVLGYFKIKTKTQGIFNDTFLQGVWSNGNGIALTSALKNSTIINSTVALISDTTSPRPNNINTNLLTAAQSQSCPSNPIIYFSRTVVREYTVGSAGVPISINNSDTVQINFDVGASINIGNNNGCQPAIGLEFDVEFIRTSPNITCYNFLFNGGTTPYVASAKQVGSQTTLTPYTNVTIING